MKKQTKLVPFNDPANVSLAFYSIRTSIERQTKALEAQTAAIVKAINAQTEAIDEMTDVLRAVNSILVQQILREKDEMLNPEAARVAGVKTVREFKAKIETAKKRLARKA